MFKRMSKMSLLLFVFIFISFSLVFAGEQEKEILKALERVSSVSKGPGGPEFREAFSDCQAEIKLAKITGSDYPKFMKVAEETFLLFKSEKELNDEYGMTTARGNNALVEARINGASKLDKLKIEKKYLYLQKDILDQMIVKREAGQRRLEDLYRVYKEEVLKR